MRLLNLQTVLAAVDVDSSSDVALESATRLARAAGARLHVVHALPPADRQRTDGTSLDESTAFVWQALERANVTARDAKLHLIPGSPAETIRSLADRLGADIIVLGAHRHDSRSPGDPKPLGSTAQAALVGASAPCLVTPVPLRLPLQRVLVPIDMSETAGGALLVAASWASALRVGPGCETPTTLTALHVDRTSEKTASSGSAATVQADVKRLAERLDRWSCVALRAIVRADADVAATIAGFAAEERADLVVLGSRGLGLDEAARLGSVSAAILARLEIPMLLVPPAVWRAHAAVA
jgi:nucleotide-binding universal stress UspA family protein